MKTTYIVIRVNEEYKTLHFADANGEIFQMSFCVNCDFEIKKIFPFQLLGEMERKLASVFQFQKWFD